VLPLHSCDAERIFSAMNCLQDALRNRLGDAHLNIAMRAYNCTHDYRRRDYKQLASYVVVCF
jgi:hypothetical protein